MRAEDLNQKYKQLKEYLRVTDFMKEDPRLWISDSNLEHLTTRLFHVRKLDNDDETYKEYLKLTYALLYSAANAIPMKDITFDVALLIAYKRNFKVQSILPIDAQMANLLYKQDILIKPYALYIDDDYFIQVENTKHIIDETHIKYEDHMIVVSKGIQEHEYTIVNQPMNAVWYNLSQNPAINTNEFDDYLKWLSDNNQQRLLSIIFLDIDMVIEENIMESDDAVLATYINLVKQLLIRNTNISNIAQKIDTALMFNMPLTPLIDQFMQDNIKSVDIPEITL